MMSATAATTREDGPGLSVVVPLFNERENLDELHQRIRAVMAQLQWTHEVILVDDGSQDGTHFQLEAMRLADPDLVVLTLSRNFGHQAAVTAGLDHARGQAVVVMDGDLQDPPEIIPQLVDQWRRGHDVVYAVRRHRKEGPFKRACYFIFYRLLRAMGDVDIPLDSGDFCLMDQRVVRALRELPERVRFVRGLRSFVGFRQVGLEYERDARHAGRPKYTFRALVRLAVEGLISFSGYPLRLVAYLGFATTLVAVGLMVWALVDALHNHTAPRGWASLIAVVLFMGSVQLVALGIIGEYVRLIFLEAKRRPTYVLRGPATPRGMATLPVDGWDQAARAQPR